MIEAESQWFRILMLATTVASVHLWTPWFDRTFAATREYWSGFVGGIALGYVILHMLPKLGKQLSFSLASQGEVPPWGGLPYLIMLFSIVVYLLLLGLRKRGHVMGVLFAPFLCLGRACYSFSIGYLLIELPALSWMSQLQVCIVFMLHLIGLDSHFYHNFPGYLGQNLRWVMAAALLAGAAMGVLFELDGFTALLAAFLAGGMLVVVMTVELPSPNRRLSAFVAGVATFVVHAIVLTSMLP